MSDDAAESDADADLPEVADCEETVHRLYHYLDGELTEDRRRAIASHLDDCGPCVEALDFESELRRVVADRCRDRVPDHLRDRVAQLIAHERVSRAHPAD
ncbi:MAG: mycothiol system anti-sigma-R factor [Actinomycetota bacterium]|nr:mycothiol system anti-sigma-R factor [Actinomycetota bacterium]